MKNLPSFKEFSENQDFIEPVSESLINDFKNLERADPYHSVNEGSLLDQVKNQISKFFLGSFSRLNMIDEARQIILELRLDLLEKEDEFENKIEQIQKEIDSVPSSDKSKLEMLQKKREATIREMETYAKAQQLKIKKSKDVAQRLAADNKRRQDYLSAGFAEDEIAVAELEYELAKKRSEDSSKIQQLLSGIENAKKEAEEKAEKLEQKTEDAAEKGKTSPTDFAIDPEKEKKKIIGKKAKDIISYKNELEKEIADKRSAIERKIESLEKKIKKESKGISQKTLENARIELIQLTEELDCKVNILNRIRSLGKTESDISKSMDQESELTALSKKINQDIKDGQDEKTGTKKIVSDLFVTSGGNIGVSPTGIEQAKKKLNN